MIYEGSLMVTVINLKHQIF